MNIRIKKLHPDAVIPQYARPGDSGFDLVAIEDVVIRPGETAKVRTGLAFEIPDGYELQIRPRSGISLKTKLRISNSPGTCDASYRGEVCVLVDNVAPYEKQNKKVPKHSIGLVQTRNEYVNIDGTTLLTEVENVCVGSFGNHDYIVYKTYIIRKGDRIAQGVIAPVIQATFEVVDELTETERGDGAFGSTGTKY